MQSVICRSISADWLFGNFLMDTGNSSNRQKIMVEDRQIISYKQRSKVNA